MPKATTGAAKAPEIDLYHVSNDFKVAGDATRLSVMRRLADSEIEICVGDLCEGLSISQPAVSHHLSLLKASRFVSARRSGKNNFYSVTRKGRAALDAAAAFHAAVEAD